MWYTSKWCKMYIQFIRCVEVTLLYILIFSHCVYTQTEYLTLSISPQKHNLYHFLRTPPGALYCDCGLRVGGFNGEGVQGSSVLVTKTHNRKVQFVGGHIFSTSRIPYGAAVLLVRDPRGALVAEWNRERSNRVVSPNVSNHFTYVGEEYFGECYIL